eukprot:TRINITY_DN11025_c0_g1_i1.p2 TRINITY_DN11025_c0_g1~~TRINITY_DN11025_c0_g1_i1.p2  ORF type:complete len:182 (-),score=35.62 TRINITY_DN11025_c0_g1_i1:145-690(-)
MTVSGAQEPEHEAGAQLLVEAPPELSTQEPPQGRREASETVGVAATVLIGPALITHSITGAVAFLWVFLGGFFALVVASALAYALVECSLLSRLKAYRETIAKDVFVTKVTVLFLSLFTITGYTYAMLLYRGENYLQIIVREYQMRDTSCYLSALVASYENRVADFAHFVRMASNLVTNLL